MDSKFIGTIIDPSAVGDESGGFLLSRELYDLLAYDLKYEPRFINP